MRTALAYKQLISHSNFKPIRLFHNHVNSTPFFDRNVPKSVILASLKCSFSDVCKAFDEMPEQDVKTVTTLISQLNRDKRYAELFVVFSRMLEVEVRPNEYTLAALVHASTALKDISLGKQLHTCAMKMSLESHVFVGSAVLDLYAKLNTIEEAQMVFDKTRDPNVVSYMSLVCVYVKKERFDDALRNFETMPEKNVITWNAMIGGYSQKGHNEEVVNLFIQMLRENIVPTQSTFPCVFSAAGNIAALKMGKSFHAFQHKFEC